MAAVGGWCLVVRLGGFRDASPILRLAAGIPVGLSVMGLVGFALASLFGMRPWIPWVAALAPAAALVGSRDHLGPLAGAARTLARELDRRKGEAILGFMLALALAAFLSGALINDAGAIDTSDHHNLGDLPFHVAVLTGFAYGDNYPPEHPELAGARLTYPFLVDFIAALLVAAGARLREAFVAENTPLIFGLLVALRGWAGALTRDRCAAWLVPVLFFLNGGLGFALVVREAYVSEQGLLRTFAAPPFDATIRPEAVPVLGALRWGNSLTTLVLPQRAFLLGLPLFLLVALLWWQARAGAHGAAAASLSGTRRMLTAGVLAGLLPLAHAHTFLVLVVLAILWTPGLRVWRRPWSTFFVSTAIVALPQILWLSAGSGVQASHFLAWQPGWESNGANPLWFWLVNAGLFLPSVLAALAWRGHRPVVGGELVRFALPFAALFLVPNLLRLSPWMWDNVKYLVFAFLGATPLVAALLARLARAPFLGARALGGALALLLILAGGLDVVRVARGLQRQRIFSSDDVAFAEAIRGTTPPRALILHAPTYNHLVYLTGRRSLLGYVGHVVSHGLDPGSREEEIRRIYGGAPDARDLIERHRVEFLVVGPHERRLFSIDERFLSTCPLVTALPGYRLHHASCQ